MGAYLLRRLLQAPLVLLVLASLSFVIMRAAPGGPFAGEKALDPQVQQVLEKRFHLHESIPRQYLRFLGSLLRGDLGPSMSTYKGTSVNAVIARELPTSLLLGSLAMLLALAVGVPSGILAAMRPRSTGDSLSMVSALVAISVPTFVIGPLLALVFGLRLHWLPIASYHGWRHPSYLVLPAIALAAPFAGRIARLTRAGLLDVLGQDFVRTARAKGASEWRVTAYHALRLGFTPVVSFLGPATAAILTGSLVIEQVFQIPGLGREFVVSALNRDFTLVMGTVIIYGAILIVCNLLADCGLALLDPRTRNR
jgi:oligopeptide transport system permease protein